MTWEVVAGRSFALCLHPLAAWRSRWRFARGILVAGYFVAAYATVLTALWIGT